MRFAFVLALLSTTACGPRLASTTIIDHRRLALEADRPEIVEASGEAPRWVREVERGDADTVVFVGQASGTSLSTAEKAANDDLSAAVARFIAVAVASESEATDTHESNNGRIDETADAHVETRAHVEASIGRVVPDARYWEKVSVRTGSSFRYFLRAAVKRAEITRARLSIACERAKKSGKKVLAIAKSDSVFANFESRFDGGAFYVLGPAELGGEVQQLEPDLLLELVAASSGEELSLSYVLRDGKSAAISAENTVRGAAPALFELEDQLWQNLSSELGRRR